MADNQMTLNLFHEVLGKACASPKYDWQLCSKHSSVNSN